MGISVLVAAGCGDNKLHNPRGTGNSTTTMVAAATGGMVTLEGTTLVVPPGALPADTAITITSTTGSPPAMFKTWSSPVFEFAPDGLAFLMPVTVTLTFSGSPSSPAVYWSSATTGLENLGGSVEGNLISTSVMHFSQGFVAEASALGDADGGVVAIDAQIPDGGDDAAVPLPPSDGGVPPTDDGGVPPTDDGGVPPSDDGGVAPSDDGGVAPSDDGGVAPPPPPPDDGGVAPPPPPPDDGGVAPPPPPPDDGGVEPSPADGGTGDPGGG
jgi:hypothetical protein